MRVLAKVGKYTVTQKCKSSQWFPHLSVQSYYLQTDDVNSLSVMQGCEMCCVRCEQQVPSWSSSDNKVEDSSSK